MAKIPFTSCQALLFTLDLDFCYAFPLAHTSHTGLLLFLEDTGHVWWWLPPWVLCSSSFLCLEVSPPRNVWQTPKPSLKSLFLNETYSDHSIYHHNLSPQDDPPSTQLCSFHGGTCNISYNVPSSGVLLFDVCWQGVLVLLADTSLVPRTVPRIQ